MINKIMEIVNKLFRSIGGFRGIGTFTAKLNAKVFYKDGRIEDLGVISSRVVTDAFVNYLVSAMQTSQYIDTFNYHGSGTGTAVESASDTTLGTEVGSRVSGTKEQGASANIYKTVATISYSGSYAITEHGVFNAASGGTLLDRSKFDPINVTDGASIQFTYELEMQSGS